MKSFTPEQMVSAALVRLADEDLAEAMDYDWLDWLEWGRLHRN